MWDFLSAFLTTKEGNIVLGATLGTVGALLGAIVASLLAWAKELYFDRRKISRDARYLALRVVLALDDFVGACYAAAYDTPIMDRKGSKDFRFKMPQPELNLPDEGDWKAIAPEIMDEALWLRNKLRNTHDGLHALEIGDNLDDYFQCRAYEYCGLGLKALALSEQLCGKYGVRAPERPDYFNPKQGFKDKQREGHAFWLSEGARTAPALPTGSEEKVL